MKPNAIRSALVAAVCLASMHSQAQNVPSLHLALNGKAHPAWSASKLTQINPDQKLQEIHNRTSLYLRSPNRVQKIGGMDGGGGNALLCQENGKVTAELLDVYEARSLGIQFELGGKTEMLDILDYTFNRLAKVSPLRATVYSAMARDLLSKDTQWVTNKQMPVIDDVNLSTIPQDCLLVQVAVQRPLNQSNLPNAKTYIIDAELFNLLDETSKAALVLHEVLYREARHSSAKDSLFSRHLVGLIMSNDISKYNTKKLNELYENNGINCQESDDTPTFISYTYNQGGNVCDFTKTTDYKVEFNKSVTFNIYDQPFSITEKWQGKPQHRLSSFVSGQFEPASLFDKNLYSSQGMHQTSIQIDGRISFQVDRKSGPAMKTPTLIIKNGSVSTELVYHASQINLPHEFAAIEITPYTSSNINHYLTNVLDISPAGNKKRAFYHMHKKIVADEITFSDTNIRLENSECETKFESCPDTLVISVFHKTNDLEMESEMGDIQIYHPKASMLNVPKEYINKDGWILSSAVRFNSEGKVSEFTVGMPADNTKPVKWYKY